MKKQITAIIANNKVFEGDRQFSDESLKQMAKQVEGTPVSIEYDRSKIVGKGLSGKFKNGSLYATVEIDDCVITQDRFMSISYTYHKNELKPTVLVDLSIIETCRMDLPRIKNA